MITYLDATENGSVILQDTTFTNGGKVLYEGKNINSICDVLNEHGFDSNDYMAGDICITEQSSNPFYS